MNIDLPESKVMQIWQNCAGREDLETEEGAVKILYRGRMNDSGGADFRDAVIQTDYGLLTGDIEIHTKSSDWRAHRHHLDPLYNRVILHVVLRHDIKQSVRLQNGQNVPTITLGKLPARRENSSFPTSLIPCQGAGKTLDIAFLGQILDENGEQRFQSRAVGYQGISSPEEAGQALYRGIMTALGYAQNKHPMAELACRMPLRRLESLVAAEMRDTECRAYFQVMLLGAAGLLPSQRARYRADDANEQWADELEKRWSSAGETATMSETDWQFFRVRPGNFPTRRIAAMSYLLLRYRTGGLLNGLINVIDELPVDVNHYLLEKALKIEAGDGCSTGIKGEPALLGKDRANDIIINVLLPFTAAWGRMNSRPELASKAEKMYQAYPPLASNTIERHMSRQMGITGALINTARRQQGLLHIFKTFCALGRCGDCPVKRAF
jgi:hypothetical protein